MDKRNKELTRIRSTYDVYEKLERIDEMKDCMLERGVGKETKA